MSDHRVLYGLAITCGSVVLRLPDEDEITALATLAGRGVHAPGERPFLTPWAEGTAAERASFVRRKHWMTLGRWSVNDWQLNLGAFVDGQPTGVMMLRARDFRIVREVTTSSWLGVDFHHGGIGTAGRAGLLTLAFDKLGATSARTDVFPDNAGSQGVSRKLGYEPDGISFDRRDDEVLLSDRLRVTNDQWRAVERPAATIDGFNACRFLFGCD